MRGDLGVPYSLHLGGVLPPPFTFTQFAKGQQRAKAGEKKAALAREFSISRETLISISTPNRQPRHPSKPPASPWGLFCLRVQPIGVQTWMEFAGFRGSVSASKRVAQSV